MINNVYKWTSEFVGDPQIYIVLDELGPGFKDALSIGSFGINVNGKKYCVLYHGWDMVSRGSVVTRVKTDKFEPLTKEEEKLFLEKWEKADNLRKAVIVYLFDTRKHKSKPPNPKTTSIS